MAEASTPKGIPDDLSATYELRVALKKQRRSIQDPTQEAAERRPPWESRRQPSLEALRDSGVVVSRRASFASDDGNPQDASLERLRSRERAEPVARAAPGPPRGARASAASAASAPAPAAGRARPEAPGASGGPRGRRATAGGAAAAPWAEATSGLGRARRASAPPAGAACPGARPPPAGRAARGAGRAPEEASAARGGEASPEAAAAPRRAAGGCHEAAEQEEEPEGAPGTAQGVGGAGSTEGATREPLAPAASREAGAPAPAACAACPQELARRASGCLLLAALDGRLVAAKPPAGPVPRELARRARDCLLLAGLGGRLAEGLSRCGAEERRAAPEDPRASTAHSCGAGHTGGPRPAPEVAQRPPPDWRQPDWRPPVVPPLALPGHGGGAGGEAARGPSAPWAHHGVARASPRAGHGGQRGRTNSSFVDLAFQMLCCASAR